MLTPFMIPDQFDLDSGAVSGNFTNLLEDFKSVSTDTAARWMKYLRKWALPVELESDLWSAGILEKSMDSELKQTVQEGLKELDEDARGGITMFKLMVTEMVIVNQETVDQLHLWLRTFDIRSVDGQNVKVAGRQIRAVVRALDGYSLPENLIPKLLEGFAQASTAAFSNQCTMLSTIHRSTVLNFGSHVGSSPKTILFKILSDIETAFASFAANKTWMGLDHDGVSFRNSMSATALQAMAARRQLPFDEWVKDKICHGCGERGHIEKDCPKKSNSSPTRDRRNNNDRKFQGRGRGNRTQRGKERERRVRKIFNAVMDQLKEQSSDDEDESVASPRVHNTEVDDGNESDASSTSNSSMVERATAMFTGLLKE